MKLFLSIVTCLILLTSVSAATFATTDIEEASNDAKIEQTSNDSKNESEEAVYCSIEVKGKSSSCWFCNCAALAEQLNEK